MKHISKIIKYSDAYKQMKKTKSKKNNLDVLFQDFGNAYSSIYNLKKK